MVSETIEFCALKHIDFFPNLLFASLENLLLHQKNLFHENATLHHIQLNNDILVDKNQIYILEDL